MNDELLHFYNRELAFLRKMGGAFAEAHPKIAGRLRLSAETVEDPHVSRLIESVAFLNARTRQKLEDDFPELGDALLEVLYPHYLAPVPSMAMVQMECDPELTAPYTVPRKTMLETEPIQGEPVRFQTRYPVTLWPLRVDRATLSGQPFQAPRTARASSYPAVLRLSLACRGSQATIADLEPGSLRFFLTGQPHVVHELYEALHKHVLEIAVASSPDDPSPALLPPTALRPVGFEPDEGMLPYTPRSFLGYRLLTELFTFPAKFFQIEVAGLPSAKLATLGKTLELYFYLGKSSADLEQNVGASTFALGCTPVVNLFERRAEPIPVRLTESEHRVAADARRPLAFEVYSVDGVVATSPDGRSLTYHPFYGFGHGLHAEGSGAFYHARRRPAAPAAGKTDAGTEVWLSLVDGADTGVAPDGWVLEVETTCLNRNLPNHLPFGGGEPKLSFSEGGGPVKTLRCLTPPTPTLRPKLGRGTRWRLVSHLVLNHLSLSGGREGAEALREILRLYDVSGSSEGRALVESLLSVESAPATVRVNAGGMPGFARGTDVRLHLDESRFSGSSMWLFASILERFLGLYCSANTFVRTRVTTNAREGSYHRWPPRAGDRTLL